MKSLAVIGRSGSSQKNFKHGEHSLIESSTIEQNRMIKSIDSSLLVQLDDKHEWIVGNIFPCHFGLKDGGNDGIQLSYFIPGSPSHVFALPISYDVSKEADKNLSTNTVSNKLI